MSENKNYTHEDLIWADISNRNVFGGLVKKEDNIEDFVECLYILKSKYDELEELRAKTNEGYMQKVDELSDRRKELNIMQHQYTDLEVKFTRLNKGNKHLLEENEKLKAELEKLKRGRMDKR